MPLAPAHGGVVGTCARRHVVRGEVEFVGRGISASASKVPLRLAPAGPRATPARVYPWRIAGYNMYGSMANRQDAKPEGSNLLDGDGDEPSHAPKNTNLEAEVAIVAGVSMRGARGTGDGLTPNTNLEAEVAIVRA